MCHNEPEGGLASYSKTLNLFCRVDQKICEQSDQEMLADLADEPAPPWRQHSTQNDKPSMNDGTVGEWLW